MNFNKENRLWFGAGRYGIGVYDGQSWKYYTTDDGLLYSWADVAIDSSYRIWAYYGPCDTVSMLNNHNWEHFDFSNELLGENDGIIFYVDKDGAMWFWSIEGLSVFQDTTTTSVKCQPSNLCIVKSARLYQNYPNPFNSTTKIVFELFQKQKIDLSIMNLNGKEVINLYSGEGNIGMYQFSWDGLNRYGDVVSSGIYICTLKTNFFIETNKIILIR
ncbi:MAG: T9SS type A sorting domain-containing protein [Candidatus Hodarchaeota archaeon]